MRTLVLIAFAGVAAAAVAGSATAASGDRHVMDVALPDGGTAHIQYYGDVAPKVTIAPGDLADWTPMAFPGFGNLDQVMQRINAEQAAMMKQMRQMTRRGVGSAVAPVNVVSYGNMPAGANSVSVVSVSNGGGTCTRTTRVTAQGQGKAPKVVSSLSGDCSAASSGGSKPAAAVRSGGPIDRT